MIGYVIYPDGGCRPNPGYPGAGIHAYRWTSKGAKGIGHTGQAATVSGYAMKTQAEEFLSKLYPDFEDKDNLVRIQRCLMKPLAKVSIDQYWDLSKPLSYGGSNNTAELEATCIALEHFFEDAKASKAELVYIRQDARYVIDHFNYIKNWVAADFIKANGDRVLNEDLWRRLDRICDLYRAEKMVITIEWVEGHGVCIGNNAADAMATMAVMKNQGIPLEGDRLLGVYESAPEGYWKSGSENRHPMLSHRFGYFSTEDGLHVPGQYYVGNQGKDVELIAKKVSDGAYGVVRMASPDPFLEMVIDRQKKVPREVEYLTLMDINAVFGTNARYLKKCGVDYIIQKTRKRKNLEACDKTLLTRELDPPYLAARAIDAMSALETVIDQYLAKEDGVHALDITSSFYDVKTEDVRVKKGEEPKTRIVYSLRPEIGTGYFTHPVDAEYKNAKGVGVEKINLTMGIDILERNALRKLEDVSPKVSLVTWMMSEELFLYATIIETSTGDVGIWSGMASNMRLVSKDKV